MFQFLWNTFKVTSEGKFSKPFLRMNPANQRALHYLILRIAPEFFLWKSSIPKETLVFTLIVDMRHHG